MTYYEKNTVVANISSIQRQYLFRNISYLSIFNTLNIALSTNIEIETVDAEFR